MHSKGTFMDNILTSTDRRDFYQGIMTVPVGTNSPIKFATGTMGQKMEFVDQL